MTLNKFVILLAMSWIVVTITMARDLPIKPGHNLESRLYSAGGGAGLVDCWNALLELKSCTNEIIIFFLDGETYLGIDCCRAIRVITRQCWPSMLTSLGFTSQEGDILRGYCDASPVLTPPPAQSPLGPVSAEVVGQ